MAQIIDGKAVSRAVRARVAQKTLALKEQGVTPGLAVILVGEDPASQVYVRDKEKACDEVGFYSEKYTLPADTTQAQLNALVDELNAKKEINGILCQLPLPPHLSDKEVIARIDPAKDVDAFHPENVGAIMIGDYRFLPCTPAGVMELIRSTGTDLTGKRAVVLGRSNIVGKPMAMLLLHENATVTIAHSKTQNLAELTRQADVLVAAVGRPKIVTEDTKKAMKKILSDIQDGTFAKEFLLDMSPAGRQVHFKAMRKLAAEHPSEKVGEEVRKLYSWNNEEDKLVNN